MKATKYLSKLTEKRTRNVLAIIAMFVCTSICLGGNTKILDFSNATHKEMSLLILINRMQPVMMLAIFR
ncbi:hypothetical protein AGMMS49921_04440 [Endomicrobiia bacterium]|nr:hypothetical protein AGMMS49921_04440 [Endomicrobiia bacterium]